VRTPEVEEELGDGLEEGLGAGGEELLEERLGERWVRASARVRGREGRRGQSTKKRWAAAYCWRPSKSRMMRPMLSVVGMRR
jgi:hypothetical protein